MIFLKKINSKSKKVFFLYTFLITVLVLAVIFARYVYNSVESYFLVTRVYNVVEYSLLAYFFSIHIHKRFVRTLLLFSPFPFIIFCVFDFVSAKEPTIAFYPLIIEYLVLLMFIIYIFFEIMQESVVEPIYQKAIFWISVAFIINFSGNFFLFLYSKTSYNDETFRRQFTIINSSVTILKNILLCISILIKEKKDTLPPDSLFDIDLDALNPIKNKP